MKDLLDGLSVGDLLNLHGQILARLRESKVLRSENNPTGDYTEWLLTQKLGLRREPNSRKGFDAVDVDGTRIQIKGRRITPRNTSRQLSVIRQLEDQPFDWLIAVIFDENWKVIRAMKLHWSVVMEHSICRARVNGHVLILRDDLLDDPAVQDITAQLSED
ncbi:hypothetical protein DK842_05085 [Chromobacterium phragmitis]|uniref:Uncharacterized protein n=1 Tax=Chromobacterium phragmitis TaxID=2202141 RepID=A0A344UHF8_9NEIS|nr:hypothetical protein [Chromobacterium phragmitis]AXE29333.1 hypothetical protein DK842_05085 [Chromobacterium phragmitis]AXE34706.1 hypothetical protein DK843_10610 [Chromobacterium phragmitis]